MKFRISSALKNIIGRDLITDDFIAIYELVKNSYDAGATQVTVKIRDQKITIEDNGKGMSKRDLYDKWLFVAYSAKKEGVEDFRDKAQKKRHYAGAKGIGRFSCDRLGNHLRMVTKTSACDQANQIIIDWSHFEADAQNEFVNIEAKYSQVSSSIKAGTILEISELPFDSNWNDEKVSSLKQALEKLVNPFEEINEEQKFSIHLDSQFEELNGAIENQVFKKLNLKTTQIVATVNEDFITIALTDRGTPLYKIREENLDYPDLNNIKINLYYLNQIAKNNFTRTMGIRPVNFGSVFIFKNGFRVAPYGDPGDDSLGLDKRKAQGYSRHIGSREVMGNIQINAYGDKFKEVSSRDGGLIKNSAYKQLTEIFLKVLRIFEKYVVDVTWVIEKKPSEEKKLIPLTEYLSDDLRFIDTHEGHKKVAKMLQNLTSSKKIELLEFNKDFLGLVNEKLNKGNVELLSQIQKLAQKQGDKDFSQKLSSIQKKITKISKEKNLAQLNASKADEARKKAEAKADKIEIAYQEERSRSKFLSGMQSRDKETLENFMHHIIGYSSSTKQRIKNLINNIKKGRRSNPEAIVSNLEVLLDEVEKTLETAKFATLADFRMDSGMIKTDISSFIYDYLTNVASIYQNRLNISVNQLSKTFDLQFSPIEIGIVLDNIVNNASKASASEISFSQRFDKNMLKIEITDNGNGVDPSILNFDEVFEKGFTRTNGSGLGLYFSKQKLEEVGGSVFINADDAPKFKLEIRIPNNEADI